jgi:long-chain fatty acid transport protein
MKKQLLLISGFLCCTAIIYGGGIVTNTNQSAAWVRTLVRDAAISPDAVYFNPAGLTKLEDGFHFSLNSQTIFQSKDVTNNYEYLKPTPKKYMGDVIAPVFPGFYATWKKNKIAVSFGFNPIGGGGGATFKNGLPSFELSVADMVPILADYGATDYRREVYFKGTSLYLGYQLGVTYQINDVISVFGGFRYVTVKNTYEGYLKNVEVNIGGDWIPVNEEFSNLADQATTGADGATGIASTMGNLIAFNGAFADLSLLQAQTAGALTDDQRLAIIGGLQQLGIDTTLNIGQLQATATGTATYLNDQATQASQTAALTEMLFNQQADVTQKGHGITPIIGVNLAFGDKLNIGIKYEFRTIMQVTNDTKSDFIVGITEAGAPIYMFPDGGKVDNDMPAMLSVGVNYLASSRLSASAGFHYYWDKGVSYGKTINEEFVDNSKVIDNNGYEAGISLEYAINKLIRISAGYLLARSGVSEAYQSDLSFDLSSNTIGGGIGLNLTDRIMVNAGLSYTKYNEGKKNYNHVLSAPGNPVIPLTDTYYQNTLILGIGVDFSF